MHLIYLQDQAKLCVGYLVSQLGTCDHHTQPALLKEIKVVCDVHSSILADYIYDIAQLSDTGPVACRVYVQQLKEICTKR